MIYYNSDFNSLPDALQLRPLLSSIQNKVPVRHLMPTERVVEDESKYILTHLSNGCFSLKPNITHQGVLFYGNCDYEQVKKGLYGTYYFKSVKEKSVHSDLLKYNVLLEQFRLLIKSFPLYDLLSKGIYIDEVGVKFILKNAYGLASAYSFVSPYINLTSSLDLAMFYATHKFNEVGNYEPADPNTIGIIYVYVLEEPFGVSSGLSTLGLQVFQKTFNTKQFLYRINRGENFNEKSNVAGFTFKQTKDGSEYFAQQIKEQEILPKDDFLAKKLQELGNKIYTGAIAENLRKNKGDSEAGNRQILEKEGFKIVDGIPSFCVEDLISVDLENIWATIWDRTIGTTSLDKKIIQYLQRVPTMDKYKNYFNIVKYYGER